MTIEQYYQKLSEIDDEIGSAFKSIDFTHTIVIVTSEYGYSFDFFDKKRPTNYFAREVIQVPMIIRWENLPIGKVNNLSSHTDLVPALMKHIFKVKKSQLAIFLRGRFI